VELLEDGDQAVLVDEFVLGGKVGGGERAGVDGAEFFQHVVHVGEGQVGIFGLLALAMGVEFFGDQVTLSTSEMSPEERQYLARTEGFDPRRSEFCRASCERRIY
jgi:hypothetical protein